MVIKQHLVNEVLQRLKSLNEKLLSEPPYVEYQDDFEFVLISIGAPPETGFDEIRDFLSRAQEVANAMIPKRHSELSWMINVQVGGKLVESVFGGDADSPDSGFI